jgi:hypothetical protein
VPWLLIGSEGCEEERQTVSTSNLRRGDTRMPIAVRFSEPGRKPSRANCRQVSQSTMSTCFVLLMVTVEAWQTVSERLRSGQPVRRSDLGISCMERSAATSYCFVHPTFVQLYQVKEQGCHPQTLSARVSMTPASRTCTVVFPTESTCYVLLGVYSNLHLLSIQCVADDPELVLALQ